MGAEPRSRTVATAAAATEATVAATAATAAVVISKIKTNPQSRERNISISNAEVESVIHTM